MRITLWPVPPAPGIAGVPVGYAGGSALADLSGKAPPPGLPVLSYDDRQPLIDGKPVAIKEIGPDLHAEVERVGKRLWGPDHVAPMAAASGLNLRSLQRGRVADHGLPVPLLVMLGRAIQTPCPRATGHMLLAVAAMWDQLLPEHGLGERGPGPMSAEGRDLLERRLDEIATRALDLVIEMQGEAAAAKARAYAAAGRVP